MDPTQAARATDELYICVGSACHQLGVYEVLPVLEGLIREDGLEGLVALKGAFCLDCCADGIVLKHGMRIFTQVNPRNVRERFAEEIAPCLHRSGGGGRR